MYDKMGFGRWGMFGSSYLVEKVLQLPLEDLLEQDPVIAEADATPRLPEDFPFFRIPGGRDYPWQHVKKRCYFYDTPEGTIWGMTAQLLYLFLAALRQQG